MPHFVAFSPLPYMAGQRYIVPVFNRLAAAALFRGFNPSGAELLLEQDKHRAFRFCHFSFNATNGIYTNELRIFIDNHEHECHITHEKNHSMQRRGFSLMFPIRCP